LDSHGSLSDCSGCQTRQDGQRDALARIGFMAGCIASTPQNQVQFNLGLEANKEYRTSALYLWVAPIWLITRDI